MNPESASSNKLAAFKQCTTIARSFDGFFCAPDIARSFDSFFCAPESRVDQIREPLHGCGCSSSTTIPGVHVLVKSAGIPKDVQTVHQLCHHRHGKLQEIPRKKKFSAPFGKGNTRVWDISGNPHSFNGISRGNVVRDDKVGCSEDKSHMSKSKRRRHHIRLYMRQCAPSVKYTSSPRRAFYESMVEMLIESDIALNVDGLENMFACYLLLNHSYNHQHIEMAFVDLLVDLHDSNVLTLDSLVKPSS